MSQIDSLTAALHDLKVDGGLEHLLPLLSVAKSSEQTLLDALMAAGCFIVEAAPASPERTAVLRTINDALNGA
jgi:hypothetical protein